MRSPPESGSRTGRGEEIAARQLNPTASASPPRSLIMDGACCDGGGSPESGGASSSASSYGSASRLQKGVRLRRRRQRLRRPLLATGGDGRGAADGAQDLALPLGMSFAAVLAQVRVRFDSRLVSCLVAAERFGFYPPHVVHPILALLGRSLDYEFRMEK